MSKKKFLFIVNVDWFFISHRLEIAQELFRLGHEVHIATSLTNKKKELEQFGFIVHKLNLKRSSANPFEIFKLFYEIYATINRIKPDILHLITIKPVLLGGIAARLTGTKATVFAISGLGAIFIANGFFAFLRRCIVKLLYKLSLKNNSKKIIFQNPDDMRIISSIISLHPDQMIMIKGSGVDLSIYQKYPLPQGRPVIMLAARLLWDKGIQEFIDAVKILKQRDKLKLINPRYVLVGQIDASNPMSLREKDLEIIKNLGQIELWGHKKNMQNILPQAHVVVLPSYREGLPKVLIEASACGRSIVTTDAPGCRDAIKNGTTGLLVPVKNHQALADTIERLLLAPELIQKMGDNGRLLAVEFYDVKDVVKKHLQVYESFKMKRN